MVRIFVSTNHLSVLYMILYARKTRTAGTKDILLLDSPAKKESLVRIITDTKKIYEWSKIVDLSTHLPDSTELNPGKKKKFIRKIKEKKWAKPFYDFLLQRHLRKRARTEAEIIRKMIDPLGQVHEINLLTQTLVNKTLFSLYPNAAVNIFEHGIGDYLFVQENSLRKNAFYCVFADSFRKYVERKNGDASYIRPLPDMEGFSLLAGEVIAGDRQKEVIEAACRLEGELALIFLEALHDFNVPGVFYTDYIDLCMKHIDDPSRYTFVIKPHPIQTSQSIKEAKEWLINRYKVRTVVIEDMHLINFSSEVLFTLWKDQVRYVFACYSSSLFYSSVLYKAPHTQWLYAYDFPNRYYGKAPAHQMRIYTGVKDLVRNVFSMNCRNMLS